MHAVKLEKPGSGAAMTLPARHQRIHLVDAVSGRYLGCRIMLGINLGSEDDRVQALFVDNNCIIDTSLS